MKYRKPVHHPPCRRIDDHSGPCAVVPAVTPMLVSALISIVTLGLVQHEKDVL